MGSLGTSVLIDGSLVLNAGWNPAALTRDLEAQWGFGPFSVDIDIAADFYEICETCPTSECSGTPSNSVVPEAEGHCMMLLALMSLFGLHGQLKSDFRSQPPQKALSPREPTSRPRQ